MSAVSGLFSSLGSVFSTKAPKLNVGGGSAPPVRVNASQLAERGRRAAGGAQQGFEANILSGNLGGPTPTQTAGGPMNATGGAKPANQTLLGG